MCGITGVWLPGRRQEAEATTRAMTDALAHRGPDAEGRWSTDVGLALGNRRLAVVGLGSTGAQPMTGRSGRWTITYNGEIYNAQTLGRRLEVDGVRFRGTSDTEVLVEALGAWGVERTLDVVDGMFAFGAWDADERRLVLARDPMGEKPLAYGAVDGGWAFGSELGALRVVPGFDGSLDPEAVTLFLRYKYVPAPWTIHPGTRKLPAGHWVEVRDGTDVSAPRPYWSLTDVVEQAAHHQLPDDPETLAELERVLGEGVASRLRADVPLGTFLSGGVDSSLVTALATEHVSHPLRTFTIASGDQDHDEADHARAVADHLGTDHTELLVTPGDALSAVPSLAGSWDEPFADSSQLPTLLLARLTRSAVTVGLSGDGGDELFGGYNRHVWLPPTLHRAARLPPSVRAFASWSLGRPAPASWDRMGRLLPESRRPRLLGLKVQKLAGVLGARDPADAYRSLISHWRVPAALVPGAVEPASYPLDQQEWPAAATLTEQFMAVDALTYLPDDVLVKVDRASMAVSLEVRVPLLARPVVELSARLPESMKVRRGEGKWALRRVLEGHVPRTLWDRPKSGFGVPIARWLAGELRPWAEDLLSESSLSSSGLLDAVPIRRAWAEHLSGRRDASYELWDVLMLQSWLDAR